MPIRARFNQFLLGFYLILLVWVIVFKLNFSLASIQAVRDINFIPFNYENVFPGDMPWMDALLNFLIFIPFGFLLSKVNRTMKFMDRVAVFLIASVAFESIQYILAIGISDITDVITNTLGGVAGVLIAYICSWYSSKNSMT